MTLNDVLKCIRLTLLSLTFLEFALMTDERLCCRLDCKAVTTKHQVWSFVKPPGGSCSHQVWSVVKPPGGALSHQGRLAVSRLLCSVDIRVSVLELNASCRMLINAFCSNQPPPPLTAGPLYHRNLEFFLVKLQISRHCNL